MDLLNAVRLSSASITIQSHISAQSNILGLESCGHVDPIAVVHKYQVLNGQGWTSTEEWLLNGSMARTYLTEWVIDFLYLHHK